MTNKKRIQHAFGLLLWLATVGSGGCSSDSDSEATSADSPASATEPVETADIDHLDVARRMTSLGYWDGAAEAAYKALVEDPNNFEAMLLAGEAEAARGKFDLSLALAESIDPEWRMGDRAVLLHARSLYELDRTSEAADIFVVALKSKPSNWSWRHRAWTLLHQVGRSEEAAWQAESLCRAGQANEKELHSLIRRTGAFPNLLNAGADPVRTFEPGLGLARWYFTQTDYRRALEELAPESESGFGSAAASALYGRLLAETQSQDQFPAWHATCELEEVEKLGDYWAALGTFFLDARQYEASARALLEAVLRNPTDRFSMQRLAKVFDALGQSDQAEQYRQRGIDLARSEELSDELQQLASSAAQERQQAVMDLTEQLLQLNRPFEVLAWSMRVHAGNDRKLQEIDRKRFELSKTENALVMASESSLIGVDPSDFELGAAFESLMNERQPTTPINRARISADSLAQPRLVNVAAEAGLHFQWYKDVEIDLASIPIHESIGGGIAVIDYDLDGWPDVYLAQGSGDPPTDACTRSNMLARNQGGKYVDVTVLADAEDRNYGSGLAAGDVNQDGFPDLFVGSLGHNRLLI